MQIYSQRKHINKKTVLILVGIIILAAAVCSGYWYFHRNDTQRDANGVSTERTPQDKKLEEQLQSDPARKQESTQTDRPTSPTVDEKTNLQRANVILTNTGQSGDEITASGFVSNVVEEGGTCTFVFVKNLQTIEKSSSTLSNATSTTCKTVKFSKSELSSGTWKVHIKYTSGVSTGESNELELSVS